MKKALYFNIIISVLFFTLEPILMFLCDWTDKYYLGAEMILGVSLPIILLIFILSAMCSCVFSVISCITNKDLKMLLPIVIFLICVAVYSFISNSDSLWIGVTNYYNK